MQSDVVRFGAVVGDVFGVAVGVVSVGSVTVGGIAAGGFITGAAHGVNPSVEVRPALHSSRSAMFPTDAVATVAALTF